MLARFAVAFFAACSPSACTSRRRVDYEVLCCRCVLYQQKVHWTWFKLFLDKTALLGRMLNPRRPHFEDEGFFLTANGTRRIRRLPC